MEASPPGQQGPEKVARSLSAETEGGLSATTAQCSCTRLRAGRLRPLLDASLKFPDDFELEKP